MVTRYLLFFLFFLPVGAQGQAVSTQDTFTYQLAVAAIFYNEAEYFKEWLEYHLLAGVEHFYLFNNGSTDDFLAILRPYADRGLITLVDWPNRILNQPPIQYEWVVATQVPAYEHACRVLAKDDAKWLALIDIDEFLVPTKAQSVLEVLDEYDYASGIHIWWHNYGTSNLENIPANTLLIEALRMTATPEHDLNVNVIKTILKPRLYESFVWPAHRCSYKDGQSSVAVGKDKLKLNHYINRTNKYFYEIKVLKKEMGTNIKMTPEAISHWATIGNDILDTERAIDKFIPALREKMGYITPDWPQPLSEAQDII